jgi:hypothetical protein
MNKPIYKRWWFWAIIIIIIIVTVNSGGEEETRQTASNNSAISVQKPRPTNIPTPTTKAKLTYGDTVEVAGFEFTIIRTEVKQVDNQFSDIKEAIEIHVRIKNIGDETKDIISISRSVFGPDENEVESTYVGVYFDDSIDITTDVRAGKMLEGYYVCEYAGDGEYIMEVSSFAGDTNEIYFDVKKIIPTT